MGESVEHDGQRKHSLLLNVLEGDEGVGCAIPGRLIPLSNRK